MKNSFFPKVILLGFAILSITLSSCKKKNEYEIPNTYDFDNVSYSGQAARLEMLSELSSYAKSGSAVNADALDATKLKDMYSNSNNPFANADLNNSTKQLKNKTVTSEQAVLEEIMDSLAAASAFTANPYPVNGSAGIMQNSNGTRSYLVNANGVELAQVIEKGVMGACLYYQATAVYLGAGKMDVDNETVEDGKGTEMEHHWDESFGYLGVPKDFPANTTGLVFWGKYTNGRSDDDNELGNAKDLMNAYIAGRAAISGNDLDERDVQIAKIREEFELVVAATAIHYLNTAKDKFSTDAGAKHHALSEGYAFIYGLKWGGTPSISTSSVNSILTTLAGSSNPLTANLFNTTTTNIADAKAAIVTAFPSLDAIKDNL